jgi:hypothetical protein
MRSKRRTNTRIARGHNGEDYGIARWTIYQYVDLLFAAYCIAMGSCRGVETVSTTTTLIYGSRRHVRTHACRKPAAPVNSSHITILPLFVPPPIT